MATTGLILVAPHYPTMTSSLRALHPRLKRTLASQNLAVTELRVYTAIDGILPTDPAECDAWIVSGSQDVWWGSDPGHDPRLATLLREIAERSLPLFAINQGGQAIHTALTGNIIGNDTRQAIPSSIRNPLVDFRSRDRLLRWNRRENRLINVTQPHDAPILRDQLGALLRRLAA